jgi:hypothetical protein
MTAAEMKYAILLGIDSIFEGTAPGYNNLQMGTIMNKAQRRVFNEKKKLYDRDETIKRMLAPLNKRASLLEGDIVATADTDLTDYIHPNGTLYTLPSDIAFLTEEYVKIQLTATPTYSDPVLVLPITYDYYVKNYNNRYKKPYANLIWRLDYSVEGTGGPPVTGYNYVVELITDGTDTIGDYIISYLRYPIDMVIGTTNCEIKDLNFQDEIVSESIKIITAALNDEGYQVATNEKNSDL